MMIGIRKGPQKGRCGTKRRNEEKSTAQEENHNKYLSKSLLFNNVTCMLEPILRLLGNDVTGSFKKGLDWIHNLV